MTAFIGADRRPEAGVRLAVLLGTVAVLSGCGHKREAAATGARGPEPRAVITVAVHSVGAGEAEAPGLVQARRRAVLVSRVGAAVLELPVREGERVAPGAVVARLDDAAVRAALAAAEAGFRAADVDRRRIERLLARGAATPREADEAVARAATAEAALAAARETVSYAVLRAPFAGAVSARPAHVGDVVLPGAPLVELEGDGGLEILASVESREAAALRVGQALSARVDGQLKRLTAIVRSVSPAGDPTTHRFEVRADLPPASGLRSGLFARLLLPDPAAEARLLVPESAVVRRGGLSGVFVVTEGRARLRWVALGVTEGGDVEVRAGLDAGEQVAREAAGLVDDLPVAARTEPQGQP